MSKLSSAGQDARLYGRPEARRYCRCLPFAVFAASSERVNNFWANRFLRSRYMVAVASGLLWTAAFPNIGIAGFAWLAPGLMMAATLGKSGRECLRIGYIAGLTHYLSLLYWLLLIPYRWFGIPLGPATGWLALSGFLALFPAAWVWLVAGRIQGPKARIESPESGAESDALLPRSWAARTLWALTGAAAWVAIEMILARVFGGFPWCLLGVSQYRLVPLIQVASIAGVYGVSFVVMWVSLSLLSAGLMVIRRPTVRSVWVGEVFVPVLTVACLFNLGFRRLHSEPETSRTLRVALVQPSIPQTLIWDPSQDTNRFQELVHYSDQVLTNKAELLIWPESAVPKMVRYDTNTFYAISGLARKHGVWMIVGSDDAEARAGAGNAEQADYFNSSFLISPSGELVERYVKRNLVIFGEYVPLQRWLPFLKWFTPIDGGFTPGTAPRQFHLGETGVTTSVLICFEDTFATLARSDTTPDTDFLVNITNDGWFGQGAAQWQQAATGLFRTVENHVPLIRCCNNGLSCWIDSGGRIREILRDSRGTIYGMGFMVAEVPLPAHVATRSLTFYTVHGDLFGWACVAVAGMLLLFRVRPHRWLTTR